MQGLWSRVQPAFESHPTPEDTWVRSPRRVRNVDQALVRSQTALHTRGTLRTKAICVLTVGEASVIRLGSLDTRGSIQGRDRIGAGGVD